MTEDLTPEKMELNRVGRIHRYLPYKIFHFENPFNHGYTTSKAGLERRGLGYEATTVRIPDISV